MKACTSTESAAKQRTQEVDDNKIVEYIKENLTGSSAELKNAYSLMEQRGKEFAKKKNSFYAPNSYQSYIAAKMAVDKSKITVLKLGAGHGKTFIILMLTQHHLNKNKRVQIVVPSKTLEVQMR